MADYRAYLAGIEVPQELNLGAKRCGNGIRMPQTVHGRKPQPAPVEVGDGLGKGGVGRQPAANRFGLVILAPDEACHRSMGRARHSPRCRRTPIV